MPGAPRNQVIDAEILISGDVYLNRNLFRSYHLNTRNRLRHKPRYSQQWDDEASNQSDNPQTVPVPRRPVLQQPRCECGNSKDHDDLPARIQHKIEDKLTGRVHHVLPFRSAHEDSRASQASGVSRGASSSRDLPRSLQTNDR